MGATRGDASCWQDLLVDPAVRQAVRELKIGALPEVRTNLVKRFGVGRAQQWRSLRGFGRSQEQCLECPCGLGAIRTQDAAHVVLDCAYSESARVAAVQAADTVVLRMGQAGVSAWWGRKSASEKLRYLLQPVSELSSCADQQLRAHATKAWVSGMRFARARVADGNAQFGETVSALARSVAV